jgi:ADP-ribose pyrophosphatase YjhB (NUDIX family)
MTEDDIAQLALLLRKLAEEGLGTPRTPKDVFVPLRGVVVQPTAEVLVSRTGRDVLLTRREDRNFHGYHLPGGFVGVGEGLSEACDRIAQRELGAGAQLTRIVGHYTWQDHPYASPLSLLCLCQLYGEPRDGTSFDVRALPDDLLPQHRALIESSLPLASP